MNNRVERNVLFDFIGSYASVHSVLGIESVADIDVFGICPADKVPDDGKAYMSFVGRTAKDPTALLEKSRARLIVLDVDVKRPEPASGCMVVVDNARLFFCEFLSFVSSKKTPMISKLAAIHPTAVIGEGTSIGDFTSIGENVVIGSQCVISDHVSILSDVTLGDRVSVSPGTVIGTDGFGYEKRDDGSFIRFPHIGGVCIGNDVEIGGNTVIDRGTLGMTVIEDGVKIDNLVHISHNVHLEPDCLIIANAMVAGGVRVGKGTWVGPSSNILDRVAVGKRAFVGMGVSVIKEIPDDGRFTLKHFFSLFSR